MNDIAAKRANRTKWFMEARFGMFIHWGLYSIPARGEWVRSVERISNDDYQKYFEEFNPYEYEPREWAKTAKAAGMKYAVLTAKHHDGFCLFDSALTEYKSTNTLCKRDLVREFLDAFRAEGLKVGLYYSLLDWHHPDYPAFGDRHHPMRDNEAYKGRPEDSGRYLKYLHGQVQELITNYGKIDLFWFDFSYDKLTGEAWGATELIRQLRLLQPHIIIDNRLEGSGEGSGSILSEEPGEYAGDFASPEQIIPPAGIVDILGSAVPWEACITLNNNWGYSASDMNWKPARMIIRKLVECVSKNGNMLLNVGPNAKGSIPKPSLDILAEVGTWIKANGASIYGCGRSALEKPEWGRYTERMSCMDTLLPSTPKSATETGHDSSYSLPAKVYAHVLEECVGQLNLRGLGGKVKSARLLADNSELKIAGIWNTKEFKNDAFVTLSESGSPVLPDERDTVIELTLELIALSPFK